MSDELNPLILNTLERNQKSLTAQMADAKGSILAADQSGFGAAETRRSAIHTALTNDVAGVLADVRARFPDARLSAIDQTRNLMNGAFKTEFIWRGAATIAIGTGTTDLVLPGNVSWERARLDYQVCLGEYAISYNGAQGVCNFSCYVQPVSGNILRATVTGLPWLERPGAVGAWPVVTWCVHQFFL